MARRKKSRRSNARAEFPYRKSDEKALEEGERVGRAQYHHAMRSFANEILLNARKQFDEYNNESMDYIAEQVGITAEYTDWAINTPNALQTLYYSDSWLALEDYHGEDMTKWPKSLLDNFPSLVSNMARAAVARDIEEYIEGMRDEYFED